MSFEHYDVYFSGRIMKDADPRAVRNRIGALFKLEGAKLERLFCGEPIAIKKNVDMDQAVKYRVAFREAGALVDIRAVESSAATAHADKPAVERARSDVLSASAPNAYDLSDCAPTLEAQALPDISGLALDKPGVLLDDREAPAPLTTDTGAWELDRPGANLDDTAPAANREIDTAGLTLGPPNQGSLEDCRQQRAPTPLPDIAHLGFADEVDEMSTGKARFDISED